MVNEVKIRLMAKTSDNLRSSHPCIRVSIYLFAILMTPAIAQDDAAKPDLKTQLETYFKEPDAKRRKNLAQKIAQDARHDQVAQAMLYPLELWTEQPTKGEVVVKLGSEQIKATYQTTRYSPKECSTLLLMFSDLQPASVSDSGFVTVVIDPPYEHFGCSELNAQIIPLLLRQVRKQFQVHEQVHIAGPKFARNNWWAAIWHSTEIKAAWVDWPLPEVAYPKQVWPLLSHNLATTRIAAHIKKASAFDLAVLDLINASMKASYPSDKTRTDVRRYFRNVHQSDAVWLRAIEMRDGPWTAEQISILPAVGADPDKFITDVLKSKLGYLHGRIDGQTIDIQSRNCERIELRILDGMVDLEKPVTIMVNGRKRSEAIIRPSAETMLETAYEEWRFTRPVHARISLGIQKDTEE